MATIESVKAAGKKVWPNADNIDVSQGTAGTSSVMSAAPDPRGFRAIALDAQGNVIGISDAETLDELESKLNAEAAKQS